MNYSSLEGIAMCKVWFYLMNRFNPQANIKVFYKDKIAGIYEFGSRFPNVEFIELDYDGWFLTHDKMIGHVIPSQDLTLATWRWVEEHNLNKFICVEADAWVLASLDEFWSLLDDQPYIGIAERYVYDKPSINTGVYGYNDINGFVSYTRLMEEYYRSGGIMGELGDQWLTNSLFRHIDYNFTHPKIGFEYNCFALSSHTERADDQDIIVHFGEKYKPQRFAARKSMRSWAGYSVPVNQAKVLHAVYYKFWNLSECQALWDYCIGKINHIEHAEI
jgi:hypothetical protein